MPAGLRPGRSLNQNNVDSGTQTDSNSIQLALAVSTRTLMGHSYRGIRRMRYGTGSSWERHNDRGGSSSDATQSREPEGSGQAPRRQSEDHRQMEGAEVSF